MYSVVLMMAMTGGTETVDFGHKNRCSGSGAYACCGSAAYRGHGCRGGYACSGGYGGYGCSGGYGGCYGGRVVCGGGYGCTGGYGCGGGVIYAPGSGMAPGAEPLQVAPKKAQEEVRGPAPARIIVSLPASARLTIDNAPTTSTSSLRTLITPTLEPGNTYVYTLRADVNGVTQTQDVRVQAGKTSEAQFVFPAASVAVR